MLLRAEVALDNYCAVAVDVETSLTHSSNVFRHSDEEDDIIFRCCHVYAIASIKALFEWKLMRASM